MNKTLFQVEMRVHFTAEHPKADEFEFGILQVWLFAGNQHAAAETAKKIVSLLPYKIISAKSFPYDAAAAQGLEIICAHYAAVLGINFSLIHYPKGTDEQAVLGHWPLLVPPLNLNE